MAPDTDPSPIDVLADGVPASDAPIGAPADAAATLNVARDASARRRSRMLRIPDDEVSRPNASTPDPSPSPPAPQATEAAPPPPADGVPTRPAAGVPPRVAVGAIPRPATSTVPRPAAENPAPRPAESDAPRPADSGVVLTPMRIITIGSSEPPPPLPERRPEPIQRAEQAPPRRTDGPSLSSDATAERLAGSEELIPVDSEPSEPAPVSIEAPSVESVEPEPPPPPPAAAEAVGVAAREAHEPEGEDIALDDELPTPIAPAVESGKVTGDRTSDPGAELSSDDLVPVDALSPAAALGPLARRPTVPLQTSSPAGPPPVPKPPLVIVPPHVGTMAPQPSEGAAAARRKGRYWWEDLFNDDYLRACERMTEAQLSSEVDFIEDRLSIERGGTVLDLACGTGRHAIELARRGYEVVGFDLSLPMLARAGEEAQDRDAKLNFVQGDMREMTFEEQFDGVYCWNTSFGYFEEDKNALVIDRIHRSLKTGGLLLLDVINRDFLVRQSPSLAWFEGDGCVCMDEMTVDFITSRMKVKRTMLLDDGRSREIEYSMRVYSLHELGRILHEHRFKVCEVSGRIGTPGVFFGNESPRIVILAEKR
jgi:SAM-dependent methyltransferase